MLAVVAAVIPFAQLLSLSGLDSAAYHYIAKGHHGAYRTAIMLRLRWSFLGSLALLAAAAYWLMKDNLTLSWLFTIAAVTFPFTAAMTADYVFSSRQRFRALFWYRVAQAATSYAGVAVLLLLPLLSNAVSWFFLTNRLALAVFQAGVVVWLFQSLRRDGTPPLPRADRDEMVRYGKHLTGLNTITTVQTRVDALLVGLLLPLKVMADYSIALLVYDQLKRIWMVYYALRYPPLVRMPVARRRRRMVWETLLVFAIFVLLSAAAGAALWVLIPIILPVEYESSRPFILCLLGAFVAAMPGLAAEMYFRTRQDERSLYLIRGVAAVSGVIFPALFLVMWQAFGVAVGRVVASVAMSVVGCVLFFRDSDTGENDEGTVREPE